MQQVARIEISLGVNGDACMCCDTRRTQFVLEAYCGEGPHEDDVETAVCDRCLVQGVGELAEYFHVDLLRAAEERSGDV